MGEICYPSIPSTFHWITFDSVHHVAQNPNICNHCVPHSVDLLETVLFMTGQKRFCDWQFEIPPVVETFCRADVVATVTMFPKFPLDAGEEEDPG